MSREARAPFPSGRCVLDVAPVAARTISLATSSTSLTIDDVAMRP